MDRKARFLNVRNYFRGIGKICAVVVAVVLLHSGAGFFFEPALAQKSVRLSDSLPLDFEGFDDAITDARIDLEEVILPIDLLSNCAKDQTYYDEDTDTCLVEVDPTCDPTINGLCEQGPGELTCGPDEVLTVISDPGGPRFVCKENVINITLLSSNVTYFEVTKPDPAPPVIIDLEVDLENSTSIDLDDVTQPVEQCVNAEGAGTFDCGDLNLIGGGTVTIEAPLFICPCNCCECGGWQCGAPSEGGCA